MAINYEKVGWDTTKYFNPTNMNHMDDGIKAACDKADANEAAIADVNSNLAKKANVTIHRGWIEGTTVNIPISNGGLLVATRDDGSSLYVTCWVGISYLQKIAGDDLPLTVENNSIVGNIELYQSLTYYTF